jgi:hypothetical protein
MTRSTPNCTPGRRCACATALIACVLSWVAPGLPSAALGQTSLSPTGTLPSSPSPQAPSAGIPQAPVGHRQPRPSDLPPDVRREENANAPQQQQERSGLEGLPTICVRC